MPTLFRPTRSYRLPENAVIVTRSGKPYVRIQERGQWKLYPLTACGTKYLKPAGKWCTDITDADGRRRRVYLSTVKDAAQAMLAARMAADRDRLRSLLMEAGRRRGWPRVQLAPWMAIGAGEEGWQRYLDCPAHGPDEYQRLLAALAR
jgi:hypothetical protein